MDVRAFAHRYRFIVFSVITLGFAAVVFADATRWSSRPYSSSRTSRTSTEPRRSASTVIGHPVGGRPARFTTLDAPARPDG